MTSRKAKAMSSGSSRRGTRRTGSVAMAPRTRRVALEEMKDHFSRYLKRAASEEILITRRGRPAGLLIGFESEEDWFECRLERHPEFLERIARARKQIAEGLPTRGVARQSGGPCWLRRVRCAMAIARSKVTSRGQISVPLEVRRRLGIGPGSVLEWDEQGDAVVVRRAGTVTSAEIHAVLFPKPPKSGGRSDPKEGIRKRMRARYELA